MKLFIVVAGKVVYLFTGRVLYCCSTPNSKHI